MKRKYVSPVIECENFVANEYVAACLEYTVLCQTPNSNANYRFLYDDSNNNGRPDSGDKCIINAYKLAYDGVYHGCGKEHTVTFTEKPVANGFAVNGRSKYDSIGALIGYDILWDDYVPVFWWYGDVQTGKPAEPNGFNVSEHMIVPSGSQMNPTNAS